MSLISILIDRSLVLFPEYPRPFCMSMKTAPKHLSFLSLMPLNNTSRILFFTSSTCYLGPCVSSASNPGLVCLEPSAVVNQVLLAS